jgi:putative ABC transport system substrate-binding protein
MNPMRRREFTRLFSSTVVAWPLTARAQQAAMPVIGFLSISESSATWAQFAAGFREGLSQTDYIEGRNLALDFDRASSDGPV